MKVWVVTRAPIEYGDDFVPVGVFRAKDKAEQWIIDDERSRVADSLETMTYQITEFYLA